MISAPRVFLLWFRRSLILRGRRRRRLRTSSVRGWRGYRGTRTCPIGRRWTLRLRWGRTADLLAHPDQGFSNHFVVSINRHGRGDGDHDHDGARRCEPPAAPGLIHLTAVMPRIQRFKHWRLMAVA